MSLSFMFLYDAQIARQINRKCLFGVTRQQIDDKRRLFLNLDSTLPLFPMYINSKYSLASKIWYMYDPFSPILVNI